MLISIWGGTWADSWFFRIVSGAFDDPDVIHVDGEVNPVRDLETISEELRLKDEESLNKAIEKIEKVVVRGDKKLKPEFVSIFLVPFPFKK